MEMEGTVPSVSHRDFLDGGHSELGTGAAEKTLLRLVNKFYSPIYSLDWDIKFQERIWDQYSV